MNKDVGIIRSEKTLIEALKLINKVDNNWQYVENEYYSDRLRSLKTVASLVIKGALNRKETRGSHIRVDFPEEANIDYYVYQSKKSGVMKKNPDKYELK